MDGESLGIRQNNIEALRELFPNIFSERKIDLEKFKAAFCDDIYFHNYSINNNELVIALTEMGAETATEIIALQPQKVIALDRLFSGNDELKTNTALQMRDAGVDFKTI
jgi:hypothetical protein